MFFPSRARLASRRLPMHRRRNLENYVIAALRVRGSRLAIHATLDRAAGDLEGWRNKILTIFAPYTFSRSQGHFETKPRTAQTARHARIGPKADVTRRPHSWTARHTPRLPCVGE